MTPLNDLGGTLLLADGISFLFVFTLLPKYVAGLVPLFVAVALIGLALLFIGNGKRG